MTLSSIAALQQAIEALEAARNWHNGDAWRRSKNEDNRGAWRIHCENLDAALSSLRAVVKDTGEGEVPAVLFDGYAVLQALDERAKTRTSAENVSDVLDAVVRLLRLPPPPKENTHG